VVFIAAGSKLRRRRKLDRSHPAGKIAIPATLLSEAVDYGHATH
jgi:hypothetical protein